jgi:hypothetical protein
MIPFPVRDAWDFEDYVFFNLVARGMICNIGIYGIDAIEGPG